MKCSIYYKLCAFILLFSPLYALPAEYNNITNTLDIVVNASVPEKKYTLADIRAIFAMRKTRWNNGQRIHVFVLADKSPQHHQFTKSKLNMFPHQLRRNWDRLVFSGTGQAPVEVESMEQMQHKLETVPDAIGYLNKSAEYSNLRVLNYE